MNKHNILYIIDDDYDDRDFLIVALKDIDAGFECYTAANGQEGIKKLEAPTVPVPGIIFLDLNMPRINGRQFLLMIKQNPKFESIPVIIYTTSSNPKDIEEMKLLGATDYLIKQTDYHLLKEKLHQILSKVFSY